MENTIEQLFKDSKMTNTPLYKAYKELTSVSSVEIGANHRETIDYKVAQFKKEHENTYTLGALNEGIKQIVIEETEIAKERIAQAKNKLEENKKYIASFVDDALAKSEDVPTEEITKRNYQAQELRNDIELELAINNKFDNQAQYLDALMQRARKDTDTALALKHNLFIFTRTAREIENKNEKSLMFNNIEVARNELERITMTPKNRLFNELKNDIYNYGFASSEQLIEMNKDYYRFTYDIDIKGRNLI